MHPAEKAEFDAAELIIKEVYVCARPWTQCWRRAEPMISIYTKAQLVDVMADDPDDVVLADIWDRAPAYDYANRPPLTPKQWLEFGKWLSEESAGQSTDLLENLEAFKPTTCGKRDAATTWVITGTGMLNYNPSLVAASVKVLETSAIPDTQVTFAPGSDARLIRGAG
jgi:hypothetical protein